MTRRSFRRLFRFPPSEDRVRGDVEHEIDFHVETRAAELTAQGMAPDAARARAVAEFGDLRDAREELEAIARRRVRDARRADWWSDFHQDVRYGLRALRRAPLFALLAVVTLALGIGANAAVFSVLKSVLIDALPYRDAGALVRVSRDAPQQPGPGPLNAATIAAIAERQRSFQHLAAFADLATQAVYGSDDGPRTATVVWVEPHFFQTLGVEAALGRTFAPGEGTNGLAAMSNGRMAPDTAAVVVASHGAWQRLLGGDPAAAGREVRLDGVPRIVIGVLPRQFVGPTGGRDFYVPMDLRPVIAHPLAGRGNYWLSLIGRLQPGMSVNAAQQELAGIAAGLDQSLQGSSGVRVSPGNVMLRSQPLRDTMVGNTRRPLLALMGSAGLVLLIACANLAAALLSRTLSRRKEFGVRLALGAGRGRLVRQLLTESLVLAGAGGAVGLLLATLVLALVRTLATPALPVHATVTLDAGAALVMSVLALGTGLVFGLAPAFSVPGSGPQAALREEARGTGERGAARWLRGTLVACQIALCVSLLAGAGLLARSLWAMTGTPLGLDANRVLAVSLRLPVRDYATPVAMVQFLEASEDRLRALPGVEAVASTSAVPTNVFMRRVFTIEGAPPLADGEQPPLFLWASVTDEYFRTLRIPVRQGRTFDTRDRGGAVPTVVISESTARRYWPSGGALGAHVRLGQEEMVEVIGIVGDVRNDPARPDAEPMGYRSMRQAAQPITSFLVRTQGDPRALVPSVERELASIDRGLPLERATTLRDLVGEQLAGRQLPLVLIGAFGAFALLLASVGVYAMFANLIAAREREFGVRLALGSTPGAIAGLVFRQGARWLAVGLTGGALGVVLVVRVLRDLLYGVPAFDPIALSVAVSVLIACAALAMLVPLRRAVRLDPAATLRAQ
jgi:predicted permease